MSEDLKEQIREFCTFHKMAKSTFGRMACGDPVLWRRLLKGREIAPAVLRRIARFIVTYEPPPPEPKPKVEVVFIDYLALDPQGPERRAMVEGSRALLAALWREHRAILRHASDLGRNVEKPS
jgi:hypothetical protein